MFVRALSVTIGVALLFCSAGASFAIEPFIAPGLKYCAPPIKPSCVDEGNTYKTTASKKACQKDVERFVPTVFAYRVCLNQEMERAVLQTNETLRRFKCREKGGKKCL